VSGVTNAALRDSIRVDLARISPWGGALRAVPVVALVAFGLGIGSARTALTLGIGANLIAVVSLVGTTRVAMSVVVFDVVGLGCASFVGAATAFDTPIHLAVLAVWCLVAGMLVVFGLGPATAGVQSVIAFVVFGRFSDGPMAALSLGALVASGGAVEGLTLLALRLPATSRAQRARLALAYQRLSTLSEEAGPNAGEVAADIDSAAQLIGGDTAVEAGHDASRLQSLVDEARRVRLELIAVAGLRRRLEQVASPEVRGAVARVLEAVGSEISAVAADLRSGTMIGRVGTEERGFTRELITLHELLEATPEGDPLAIQLLTHLEALAGQLRAVTALLAAPGGVRRFRTPGSRSPRQLPTIRDLIVIASSDVVFVRESLTLSSSAFRHALRLAFAVPVAELIANALGLPRSYWVAFAVAVVLKPDYSSLFRRGLGRVVGTILGATLAALIVGGLHPGTAMTVVLIALCAWAAYSLWRASFAVAIGFVTALVLFLISTTQVDTLSTATDRLIDTVLGGAIALGVYVAWPTWSSSDAYDALERLVADERVYLGDLFAAIEGDPDSRTRLGERARAVRLAFGAAEAAIGRSEDEPRRHRFDDDFGRSILAAARRVVQSAHSLRSEVERDLSIAPLPQFEELASLLDRALTWIGKQLGGDLKHEDLGLRDHYLVAASALAERGASPVIALQLDEIIDAVNTMGSIVSEHNEHVRNGIAPIH
jgi:uncharacterized membrane protein YccC